VNDRDCGIAKRNFPRKARTVLQIGNYKKRLAILIWSPKHILDSKKFTITYL